MDKDTIRLFFTAIGNTSRYSILEKLVHKESSVNSLVEKTGLSQSNVSHHMECLMNCGFVEMKSVGKEHIYSINNEVLPILEGIENHMSKYEKHLMACGIIGEAKTKPIVTKNRRASDAETRRL
jgi:DNA-binding transcriptional ArsR family regulator